MKNELLLSLGSFFLMGLFFCIGYPLIQRFWIMQKVCNLIYSSKMYQINDIEMPGMMTDKPKVKKEIAYFPRIYVKLKKGFLEITIQLDGSQFHVSGLFEGLGGILEQVFSMSLLDVEERNGFYTYKFLHNAEVFRLSIADIVPKGTTIPLMRHLSWDMDANPHALIVGGTGGGKSFFLNILIRALALMGADLHIADPKNSDLADFEVLFEDVQTETDAILRMLEKVVKEMERRYEEMKQHPNYRTGQNYSAYEMKPYILILDEYVAFQSLLTKKVDKELFSMCMQQIILKGRQAGVFLILATQRPDAKFLPDGMRDQFGLRIALGQMSQGGYRMIFDTSEQKLRAKKKKGRGYSCSLGDTLIQEFYSPLVPPKYDFILELQKALGAVPCAFSALDEKASASAEAQSEPLGERESELNYQEEDR
ncbi:TPA: DNA translocase FtsK [Listeria monocytogenes]|nr:DNA translocase FtsK [Listeria monocytogenes]